MFSFDCPECQSKTVFDADSLEDIASTSTFVCPSCQTLYDLDNNNNINTTTTITKSKFDKTNYRKKITGIENQLDMYGKRGLGSKSYTVPCPHCQYVHELKGLPIKSVHWCSNPKCYQYFGIDDVKVTFFTNGKGEGKEKERQFKHDFQTSKIYPGSIFQYDIDKLADWWSNHNE